VSLENTNVFISITSPPTIEVEVIEVLKGLGAKNIFSFIECLCRFPELVKQCTAFIGTWYRPTLEDMLDEEKFTEVAQLLKDERSIKLLDSVKKFREELSPETYLVPDIDPQYFPRDIELFSHMEGIKFADCGAFIGDTLSESIVEFEKAGKSINCIVAFEPDINNIIKLSAEINKQKALRPEIDFFTYPCGVWSSNEILHFSNSGNSNSSIVNGTNENVITIMGVSLDRTLSGLCPNYIKMDIEGSEREAILGAKEIISLNSPVLAISLYHKPQDVWDLPLLINEINPNYDMYMRIYGHMGLELVLYCVPKKNV